MHNPHIIAQAYAEDLARTEYDLHTVQQYFASSLTVNIDLMRKLAHQRSVNRMLQDENTYLRELLQEFRGALDTRSLGSRTSTGSKPTRRAYKIQSTEPVLTPEVVLQ